MIWVEKKICCNGTDVISCSVSFVEILYQNKI